MTARILIVDDHRLLRQGLRVLLERSKDFEVVGEAEEGRTAVSMVETLQPDVVVMDLRMPNLNGIEATHQILAVKPGTKVIGLSGHSEESMIRQMLRAGASGYLLKDAAFDELADAIRNVMSGKVYLGPTVSDVIASDYASGRPPGASAFDVLSRRELEILQLIAEGKGTKEVAAVLQISIKTVETHRRNTMEKLRVDSIAELTKYAVREGITAP